MASHVPIVDLDHPGRMAGYLVDGPDIVYDVRVGAVGIVEVAVAEKIDMLARLQDAGSRPEQRNTVRVGVVRRVARFGEDGSCWLCHKQRSRHADCFGMRTGNVSLAEANRDGQLFFADMWNPKRGGGTGPT